MGEIDRRYFESLMADKKLSLRALAARMGLGHSQLSLTFSGARRAQLDEAAQLSQIFGQPLHRIVEALGVAVRPVSGRRVSVVGAVGGDGTVSTHKPGVIERTSGIEEIPEDSIAIQARTSGTPLDFIDGWVFFAREPNGVDPSVLGRLAYCKIKNGPAVIAAVRRGYEENSYNLSGFYAKESAALEFATPVLMVRP